MEDQSNVIFNLDPTQKPSSVSWLVLKQIHESGDEVEISGYTVKTKQKISILQEQRRGKKHTTQKQNDLTDAKPFLTLWLTGQTRDEKESLGGEMEEGAGDILSLSIVGFGYDGK